MAQHGVHLARVVEGEVAAATRLTLNTCKQSRRQYTARSTYLIQNTRFSCKVRTGKPVEEARRTSNHRLISHRERVRAPREGATREAAFHRVFGIVLQPE